MALSRSPGRGIKGLVSERITQDLAEMGKSYARSMKGSGGLLPAAGSGAFIYKNAPIKLTGDYSAAVEACRETQKSIDEAAERMRRRGDEPPGSVA